MHFAAGVAHFASRGAHHCPWPSPIDTGPVAAAALFGDLPSLALEEVFWHHLVDAALCAAAAALADDGNEDDDVTDVGALRVWLDLACAPLRGSLEFCRVARRLLAAWHDVTDARFGARGLAWRGVLPAPRPAQGSVTLVYGARRTGKTTAALRLGRVLARRVRHVVCVVGFDSDLDRTFARLAIVDYECAYAQRYSDAPDVDHMWEDIGPLVRAYAREGILVLVDDLYWATVEGAHLIDEIVSLGAHLVVTSQGMVPCEASALDRLVWPCHGPPLRPPNAGAPLSRMLGIDPDRVTALYDECARDRAERAAIVAQRRRDGTCDAQVMPHRATPAPPPSA
ncbi:hypothetical protein [Pandoravirus japonicus]|uniref:Uncharacterized protein n=1 Tax=Pandoravirus japonicus TaxID=2823154 RepID=A0A811BQ09_9VIRU|nr:hypothetical protein [Pandoravirus japonicus]